MWLDKIVAQTQKQVDSLEQLDVNALPKADGDFLSSIKRPGFAVIAEMKQRSPSSGELDGSYDPASRALAYQQGGADALSVLTNEHFFGGSFEHVRLAAHAVDVPVLCKDFIIDERQIYHARAAGAQAVLLIVRLLSDQQLLHLQTIIESLNMTALVEIFSAEDARRALNCQAKIIGINNRNLDTLELDTSNSHKLRSLLPADCPCLSLSGIARPEDVRELTTDFDGVLLGTALMQADDPEAFVRQVVACSAS